jgi:hypothetical protein
MIASEGFLSLLVTIAVVMTMISPVLLLAFLIRDWKRGEQW